MKIATLVYIGNMEGFGKPLALYNITALSAPSKTLCVKSTVTLDSVKAAGFIPQFEFPEVVLPLAPNLTPELF